MGVSQGFFEYKMYKNPLGGKRDADVFCGGQFWLDDTTFRFMRSWYHQPLELQRGRLLCHGHGIITSTKQCGSFQIFGVEFEFG